MTEIYDGINVVHNFLSSDEINQIQDYIDKNPTLWQSNNYNGGPFTDNILVITNDFQLTKDIHSKLKPYFINGCPSQLGTIHRFKNGQQMDTHNDEPKANVIFGIVIYINDNYDGGEIIYHSKQDLQHMYPGINEEDIAKNPGIEIKYKPVAGDMVYHDSAIFHKVNKVLGNQNRYAMSSFVKGCTIENCDGGCWNSHKPESNKDIYGNLKSN